jgi:hypothetical protein
MGGALQKQGLGHLEFLVNQFFFLNGARVHKPK